MPNNATPRPPSPLTAPKIKRLAAEALSHPSKMTAAQIRELGGSVMAHIEPRKKQ